MISALKNYLIANTHDILRLEVSKIYRILRKKFCESHPWSFIAILSFDPVKQTSQLNKLGYVSLF